ncbi:hypothetical protein HQ571_04170 [Candidatus Kuenenbacteria bacterium]|nr:hypothetical protein [Candidatus Kuenenbacteria bacterium]
MRAPIIGLAIFLAVVGIIWYGSWNKEQDLKKRHEVNMKSEKNATGVILHGRDCWGWIQNNNTFEITIKQTNTIYRRYSTDEYTRWVTALTPGERQKVYIRDTNSFYIYNPNGILIGFIQP